MIHQYHPLPTEYVVTGLIGVILYIILIIYSLKSMKIGVKSKTTKRFFFCVIMMGLFELPRFFIMIIEEDYTSRIGYCFHLFAGIFFFAAFSIVCRQWSGLLQLGSYFRVVYGLHSLILSNICFGIIDIVAIVLCARSSSLESFFLSTEFEVITFIEGVRNCVYSSFLTYYGIKLIYRFWYFSKIERQATIHKSFQIYLCIYLLPNNSIQTPDNDAIFTKVVIRMTSILILSTTCFVCRICMLIVKMITVHNNDTVTTPVFSLFGLLWFILSDFIPRVLPTLSFIYLMSSKRTINKDIKKRNLYKHPADQDDFQFTTLASSASGIHYNSSINIDDTSIDAYYDHNNPNELILKSDYLTQHNHHNTNILKSNTIINSASNHNNNTHGSFPNNSYDHINDNIDNSFDNNNDDDEECSIYEDEDDETIWNQTEKRFIDNLFSMISFTNHSIVNVNNHNNTNNTQNYQIKSSNNTDNSNENIIYNINNNLIISEEEEEDSDTVHI